MTSVAPKTAKKPLLFLKKHRVTRSGLEEMRNSFFGLAGAYAQEVYE